MWEGLREVMRDKECTLGGKGLISMWSDKHPLDGKVVGALQPGFAPAIRQVQRLVSEIPALSFLLYWLNSPT